MIALLCCVFLAADDADAARKILDDEDLPAIPTLEQARAFVVHFGRDQPTPEMSEQVVAWFRRHTKESFADVVHRLRADDDYIEEWDELSREVRGKALDTVGLIRWPGTNWLIAKPTIYRAKLALPTAPTIGVEIHGTVRDAAGHPVEGAEVRDLKNAVAALTNAQGRYRMLVPPFQWICGRPHQFNGKDALGVRAFVPGYGAAAVARLASDRPDDPFDLSLAAPDPRRIVFKSPNGDPVPNVGFWAVVHHETLKDTDYDELASRGGMVAAMSIDMRSNAKGILDLSMLPAGVQILRGEASHRTHARLALRDPLPKEIVLEAGCVVEGRVFDPNGKPARLASVDAFPIAAGLNSHSMHTDRFGRFRFAEMSPGEYRLLCSHRKFAPCHQTVAAAAKPVSVELALQKPRYVTGRFVVSGGTAPADITLTSYGGTKSWRQGSSPLAVDIRVKAKPDGTFRFGPLPPDGEVGLEVGSWQPTSQEHFFFAPAGKDDLGEIELPWSSAEKK